ncbi:MAG: ATP-binding cassette domain-containing protein, partial [Firmicutes bacterium]|nr:ATP-binding cassette domain-containing protein [Bacillota bacterium]
MALVTLENLSYWYPGAARPALNGVNLVLREGEFVLVVGGSGSGKSTLLRLLAGLLGDFYGGKLTGRATFMGHNLLELDRRQVARHVGL